MNKGARLQEFFRRLRIERAARSFDEAYGQIFRILNTVEDQFSNQVYDLTSQRRDLMYPPQWDRIVQDPSRANVTRLRSVSHETLIGNNGSIQVRKVVTNAIIFNKVGEDGQGVDDL